MESLWLIRHGETEWSRARRHTGTTDLPLTSTGRAQAEALTESVAHEYFDAVFSSPLRRAQDTAAIAGLADRLVIDKDLIEFNYGAYEGLTTAEIRSRRPGWNIWTDGCPEGESPAEVFARARSFLRRATSEEGTVVVFSHAHMIRALVGAFTGIDAIAAKLVNPIPASICELAYEREVPVIERWNDAGGRASDGEESA